MDYNVSTITDGLCQPVSQNFSEPICDQIVTFLRKGTLSNYSSNPHCLPGILIFGDYPGENGKVFCIEKPEIFPFILHNSDPRLLILLKMFLWVIQIAGQ